MRRNWRDEARRAIERLRDCPYGERETRLRSFASELNYENGDPSSLRRAIGALEFLDRLRIEQPLSHAHLDGVPLSTAELMGRLYNFDPSKFPVVAKDWEEGRVTVASMRELLKNELPSGYAAKTGRARQRSFKDASAEAIKRVVAEMNVGEIGAIKARADQKDTRTARVDYIFELLPGRTVAAITVGPYRNHLAYRDRAEEWALRAFGLAWIYDIVLLVLPEAEVGKTYLRKVQDIGLQIANGAKSGGRLPRVEVASIFVEPFGPEYAAIGDLAL